MCPRTCSCRSRRPPPWVRIVVVVRSAVLPRVVASILALLVAMGVGYGVAVTLAEGSGFGVVIFLGVGFIAYHLVVSTLERLLQPTRDL